MKNSKNRNAKAVSAAITEVGVFGDVLRARTEAQRRCDPGDGDRCGVVDDEGEETPAERRARERDA